MPLGHGAVSDAPIGGAASETLNSAETSEVSVTGLSATAQLGAPTPRGNARATPLGFVMSGGVGAVEASMYGAVAVTGVAAAGLLNLPSLRIGTKHYVLVPGVAAQAQMGQVFPVIPSAPLSVLVQGVQAAASIGAAGTAGATSQFLVDVLGVECQTFVGDVIFANGALVEVSGVEARTNTPVARAIGYDFGQDIAALPQPVWIPIEPVN